MPFQSLAETIYLLWMIMVCLNAAVNQHKYTLNAPSTAAFPEMKTVHENYSFLKLAIFQSKWCTFIQEHINTQQQVQKY